MDKQEKTVKSNLVFEGKVVSLYVDDVKCPNGNLSKREIVRHHGGVCVLAIVDNKVIIEKQYRYAYDEELYELPAGKLEKDENPYDAGLRELEEETGYKATSLIDYGVMYPTCGYCDEKIYLYVAEGLSKTNTNLDEDEVIDVEYIELDKIKEMIENGTIKDAKTIILISKYLMKNAG